MCYHAKFGRSRSNRVRISKGEPPNWGPVEETPEIGERWGFAPLGWEAWLTPRNTPLPRVLPCRTWSFCVKGCRHKELPKLGSVEAPSFGVGRGWLPKNKLLPICHMCYHVKLSRSESKGVRINRRDPQIGERFGPDPLWWGRGWPLQIRLSPTCVTLPNLVILGQTVRA